MSKRQNIKLLKKVLKNAMSIIFLQYNKLLFTITSGKKNSNR